MHPKLRLFVCLLSLLLLSVPFSVSQAARGTPESMEFGYGAHLHLDGPYLKQALEIASSLPLDWIAVDFIWSSYEPESNSAANWATLDRVMTYAAKNHISVMLSITQPPAHALTPQGPDTGQTSALVNQLLSRYPESLLAIELFPGANTQSGWGAKPDPKAYAKLFSTIESHIHQKGKPVTLIIGGLQPLAPGSKRGMDDLKFLQGIYDAGIRDQIKVIGLQMPNPTGLPITAPAEDSPPVLRHYEEVRRLVLHNQHQEGIIWITHLDAPSGKISVQDRVYRDPKKQAEWLVQAFSQLRAQLYVGAVFYDSINPPAKKDSQESTRSLILDSAKYHPFYSALRGLIAENASNQVIAAHGRPKGGELIKRRP